MERKKMSLQAKKELVFRMKWQYAEANRKDKTTIIDGVVAATGYHRKYATAVLRQGDKPLQVKRTPSRIYNEEVKEALVKVWQASNQICSKRLAPFLPEFVATLERFGHLQISSRVRELLLALSPATIDRLLKEEREKQKPHGLSTTKPGNLLKQRIKVRTFAEWNEVTPGFFEADLVAHCGDHVDGSFLNTLVVTDISSCWTEFAPLLRKSDVDVTAALNAIRAVLPITLLGLDTDNGSEFINFELFDYCEQEKITFTRSRPYKKNDQAHVEQKNGSIIRRTVGYERFEGVDAWNKLLDLYRVLRLYANFFQPSLKLLKKERVGAKIKKTYDKAKTPYQRLLDSEQLAANAKQKMTEQYLTLDPMVLFEQLAYLQRKLLDQAVDGSTPIMAVSIIEEKPHQQKQQCQQELNLKPISKTKRAYRRKIAHTWRTRNDPLADCIDVARRLFEENQCITGQQILEALQRQFPTKIKGTELKTIQRRLAAWRKEKVTAQEHHKPSNTTYDTLACRELLTSTNPLCQGKALALPVSSG
jgi:uncharacterized protein YggL (DUF469 family)